MNTATIAIDDAVAHVTFREDIDTFLAAFARDGETQHEAQERDTETADEFRCDADTVLFHQYIEEQTMCLTSPRGSTTQRRFSGQ